MKANESYIHQFLDGSDKKFIIPVYQRPYSWKKKECKILFTDLMTVFEKKYESHFFGGIVYVAHNTAIKNEYTIIDGQQRVTTISILLLAIRNYILKNKIETTINPRKITNAYLTDEYSEDEKKLKLKLVQGDDQAYDKLIDGETPIENNNVTANYNYFYEEISILSIKSLEGLYEAITKLMIVNISLNPTTGDDPQLIFESLNSTGLALDEADKIRNYILMKINAKTQEKFYKKYWEVIEKTVTRDDINKFIRYYLATKTSELANERNLYFAFKNYKLKENLDTEILLEDMLIYAKWYNQIKTAKNSDTDFKKVLSRLNKLDVNSCIPLLFNLFEAHKESKLNDNEIEQSFSLIENYIIRRVVCGLATNQLNKVFVGLGGEIKRYIKKDNISYYSAFIYAILSKSGKSRFPNNHDFADKFVNYELYNARPAIKKYFLERLENFNTKEKVAVEEQIDNGTLTIEHIMPQTLNKDWKDELGNSWELVHTKYKDTIGNLTLTAYNSDYSNLAFTKKKDMPEKGFDCSKLSLNSYLKKCNLWDEQRIKERAKELYNIAEKIWWLPISNYNPKENEQWLYWDDDCDYTNMLITKIRFMGDEIDTSNISDVYRKINEFLYDLDSIAYLNMKSDICSDNPNNLRKPFQIANNIYIETNLSSQDKVKFITKLATEYKLDPQDIQFLAKEKVTKIEFDIENPNTYSSLTIGQLAYKFFEHLIKLNKISEDEIILLKDKAYTKKKFNRTDYPIIANDKLAYKGNSKTMRYRQIPLMFNEKEIYITTQWFEGNREDLINWYNRHL